VTRSFISGSIGSSCRALEKVTPHSVEPRIRPYNEAVRLRSQATLVLALGLVLVLSACGGGYSNKALAEDVTKAMNANSPLVCWSHKGYIAGYYSHSYNHVCGLLRTQATVYIDVNEKKHTWCSVAPRYARLPVCPN
jgi:hypothetical protein